jgi:hypothetical protein
MNNYLVHIGDAWIDVRGTIIRSNNKLRWIDFRDKSSGVAEVGDYIPHFPRKLSKKEKGNKINGQ